KASTTVSLPRLALLGLASLLAPVAQAIQAARHAPLDLPVVLGATIGLFLLAIVRMGGFVREQQQSSLRERALREAGEALETATSREGSYQARRSAARWVAGESSAIRLYVGDGGPGGFDLVACSSDDLVTHRRHLDIEEMGDAHTRELLAGRSFIFGS